jgi:hypothetical protein
MITKKPRLIVPHVPEKLFGAGTLIKSRLVHQSDDRSSSCGPANLKITTLGFPDRAKH